MIFKYITIHRTMFNHLIPDCLNVILEQLDITSLKKLGYVQKKRIPDLHKLKKNIKEGIGEMS